MNPPPSDPVQRDIPSVVGLPVLGSLLPFMKNPITFLRDAHAVHGDVFRFSVMNKRFTVLAGLEANRFMASEGRDHFSSRDTWGRFLRGLNCPHLFIGVDGEMHQYQRKLFKPQLSKAAFRDRLHLLIDPVIREIDAVDQQCIEVGPWIRNLVCKQIGMGLQGVEVSSRQTEDFMTTQNTLLNVYLLGKWPRLALLTPRFISAAWRANAFSRRIRRENRMRTAEQRAVHPTYLDALERGQREHPEWFTEGDMRAQTMLPFIGGVDPVGGTLSFAFFELLKQPALLSRVQKEVDTFWDAEGGFPGLDAMESMEDVKGLILETMRLYPIAYAMSRSASQDFKFGGYSVQQDEELMIFSVANNFKAEYFPDPERFDIERYRAPRHEHKQGAVYAPFGRGPHTCVAAGLAELQLTVTMIALLRHLDFSAGVPLGQVTVEFLPGPFMSKNFRIKFRKRNP